MIFDGCLDYASQFGWLDCIELDGNLAEIPRSTVSLFCWSGRQIKRLNLFRRHGYALEIDLGIRCQLVQRLLDLLASIDTGGIEVAQMIDVRRYLQIVDVLGRAVQE